MADLDQAIYFLKGILDKYAPTKYQILLKLSHSNLFNRLLECYLMRRQQIIFELDKHKIDEKHLVKVGVSA